MSYTWSPGAQNRTCTSTDHAHEHSRADVAHWPDKRYVINQMTFVYGHYNDVIMGAMASQIAGLTIVYWITLFRRRSKKTSKLRVTGLCMGNSPATAEFPAQIASNAETVSIWWCYHGLCRWDAFCSEQVFIYIFCMVKIFPLGKIIGSTLKGIQFWNLVQESEIFSDLIERGNRLVISSHRILWNLMT